LTTTQSTGGATYYYTRVGGQSLTAMQWNFARVVQLITILG